MSNAQDLWGASNSYDQYMGRWSRKVAPTFLAWLKAPDRAAWIDIGCGTGVLTSAILDSCNPSEIVAVDSALPFIEAARFRITDPRVQFEVADAQEISAFDHSVDCAVSGLVLNFLPNKAAAIRVMTRVVRPGGVVGLYVWDYAGHMQLMRYFFDVATALDPEAAQFDDGTMAPICRPGPLSELFTDAGLRNVECKAIDITTEFANFDDYWTPFLGGTGSAPKYCMSISEVARRQLREALHAKLPKGPDDEILLAARAWAVKGLAA
ncbi:methyltransferase domain-containing protein (plasmid) [Rhizobium sp. TH2]|uniref:class I SAM-dependent methyltransferase n=1 Tax=Rhizobium sp. TH2 TaxID=2775403 RepID=UPI0021573EB5|nr:class I SAM-dependent methyltransferase [Rhizobium sp. TH2]UVC12196.1 methyltransferase domain-containing protein [Rhizobium sp. TH2]